MTVHLNRKPAGTTVSMTNQPSRPALAGRGSARQDPFLSHLVRAVWAFPLRLHSVDCALMLGISPVSVARRRSDMNVPTAQSQLVPQTPNALQMRVTIEFGHQGSGTRRVKAPGSEVRRSRCTTRHSYMAMSCQFGLFRIDSLDLAKDDASNLEINLVAPYPPTRITPSREISARRRRPASSSRRAIS